VHEDLFAACPNNLEADFALCVLSVPTEHLSTNPRQLLTRLVQCSCAHTVDGTLRGRAWDSVNRSDVRRPWVMAAQHVTSGIRYRDIYWQMQRCQHYQPRCTCCSKGLYSEAIRQWWGQGLHIFGADAVWRIQADQSGSVWVFVLLAVEAMKTYRANPYFRYFSSAWTCCTTGQWLVCSLGIYKIPTWTTPLIVTLFVTFLVPNTSLLGHLCSVAVGYLCQSSMSSTLSVITDAASQSVSVTWRS